MIVSKPKLSALFSLLIFLLLAYGLSIYLWISVVQSQHPPGWQTILLGVAAGVALAVTYKVVAGYKKIRVSKNRIDVHYAFNLVSRRYYFKELTFWQETAVKTATGLFKELTLRFDKKKTVKLTLQEQDNYEKVKASLQRNFSKKQQKQP